MDYEELRSVVERAVRAPSVHNSQPWRFSPKWGPTGELVGLDVFADRARGLGILDPDGRDLAVSCGAAVEFARLAVRADGHGCTAHVLPDRSDPDHVAYLAFGEAVTASELDRQLSEAISTRYTERNAFEDRPVEDDLAERLREVAGDAGAWLRILDRPGDEVALAVLLARAEEIERSDDRYFGELGAWVREDAGSGDGIPPGALADAPASARASNLRLRDFGEPLAPPIPDGDRGSGPPDVVVEHPFVCVLGTESDDEFAWVETGRALARVLLLGAANGVQASPLTQVIEVASTRRLLANELGIIGEPQMVLRMGYATGRPVTPRRPVDEVLEPPRGR